MITAAEKQCQTREGAAKLIKTAKLLNFLGAGVGPNHHYVRAIYSGLKTQGMTDDEIEAFVKQEAS